MKKFLVKISIAVIVLSLFVLGVNALYMHTAYYKNLNDMGKFAEVPEHIDIVNFGASHSESAFDWSSYDDFDGFNMALGAQTIVYDEALLDYYIDRLDENSTVILEVMFKSLYEEEPDEEPYGTNITRYYQILDKEHIRQWNVWDAIKYQYIPVLGNRLNAISHIWTERTGRDGDADGMENPESMGGDLTGAPTQVLAGWSEEEMQKEGKRRAQVFMELSGSQEHGEQYEALIQMIEACQEKGIQVILVTAPTLPCFYENFEEAFLNRFYGDIEEICQKYDLLYLDYTGDERLLEDYRWYKDTDHLNAYGATVFTKIFLEDNREILRLYSMQE